MSVDIQKPQNLREFVDREVYVNQSMLVTELLAKGVVNYEDIQNSSPIFKAGKDSDGQTDCEHCGASIMDTEIDEETILCENCFDEWKDENPKEIFEWWIVSNWLLEKLRAESEPILESDFERWWGRTTTGQAILLDYVVEKIYDDVN